MSRTTGRATLAGVFGLVVVAGCADKAPEPKWPEPPPPTLAEPLGQGPDARTDAKAPEGGDEAPESPAEGSEGEAPAAAPNAPEDGAVPIDR